MKVKLKKEFKGIPSSNSLCGFKLDDWSALNRGESVELDEIPSAGSDFVETVNKPKAKSKGDK